MQRQYGDKLKIIIYPSHDYPGYSYIKVYNKNSGRERLLEYICENYGISKAVLLKGEKEKGSTRNINNIARELKRQYEPLILPRFMRKNKER